MEVTEILGQSLTYMVMMNTMTERNQRSNSLLQMFHFTYVSFQGKMDQYPFDVSSPFTA